MIARRLHPEAPHVNAPCRLVVTTLLVLVLAAAPLRAEPPVRVTRAGDRIEIDNGLVQARFAPAAGSVTQAYLAAAAGDWVLLAEGFRPPADARALPSSLYDSTRDPRHRLLVPELLQSVAVVESGPERATVELRGTDGTTTVVQAVEVRRGARFVHVEVEATLGGSPPALEYLLVPFAATFEGAPDASFAPAYRPTHDSVIGDRVFFAPLASVQKGGRFVGLVPDVDIVNRHVVFAKDARRHPDSNSFPVPVDPDRVSMPTALDLQLPSDRLQRAVLAYGMLDSVVHQHVWFGHPEAAGTMVRELSAPQVRIGVDLLLDAEATPARGYRMAARHLWDRHGHDHFLRPRPQCMPNADYARTCYPAQFAYQGYELAGQSLHHRRLPDRPDLIAWQEFEAGGTPAGGLRLHAPQWENFVAYLAWWNNACDATGLHYWGKRLGDEALVDKARRMVNLALSAPQDRGLFPAVFDLREQRWLPSLWKPPLAGYDPAARAAYWGWNAESVYQTAAASVTAGYLMEYRRTCEDDGRILPYVRGYGDFLVASMPASGCVPAWFSRDLRPLPSLAWNADGGAHAWVLAELFLATRERKYLDAAERAAAFLVAEVMPRQRWADFEAFYSCAIKPETFVDARTGQWPCNTMSMSWAMQGFLALHEATRDPKHLEAAEAVADFASLFQAAWAPHYVVTAYPFGGVTSQLGDADWLDQRAHRFAEPFVRIGLLTGRQDLVERGVAAARSSLTLVSHPRHRENGVYTHTDFPEGLGPENVDHEGFPQRPLASGPSWSSVGGLAGIAHVMRRLGGAFVDFERGLAVGVDGVRVTAFDRDGGTIRLTLESQLAELPSPYGEPYDLELRVVGLPPGDYDLEINDEPARRLSAAALERCRVAAPRAGR